MAETNGSRLWIKIVGPLLLASVIGYAVLKSESESLRRDVDSKAPREVVEAQNREVLRTLDALRQDIAELRREVGRRP